MRPQPPPCPKCNARFWDYDRQDAEWYCVPCGWRPPVSAPLPLVQNQLTLDGRRKPKPLVW
jgi:hypothetical protein